MFHEGGILSAGQVATANDRMEDNAVLFGPLPGVFVTTVTLNIFHKNIIVAVLYKIKKST